MDDLALTVRVAGPADAEAFVALRLSANPNPPADAATLVQRFLAAPPERAANRYIVYQRAAAVACFSLPYSETRVSLDGLVVAPQYYALTPTILQRAIELARQRGRLLEAHYPPQYRQFYLQAGFQHEQERVVLQADITDRAATAVALPATISLRPPQVDEVEVVGAMLQASYAGTSDAVVMGENREAAIEQAQKLLGGFYGPLDFVHSRLAVDEQGQVVAGNLAATVGGREFFILSLSVIPTWQGKGLGRALLADGFNQAKAAACQYVGLAVSLSNEKAYNLYRSSGMREVHRFFEAEMTLTI
jgi:ribosomal protein S18 acetylase RimI-like enzyme